MVDRPIIFLSSTWADLEEHREAVLFTLGRLQKRVEAMEYFGALPSNPLSESLRSVRRSGGSEVDAARPSLSLYYAGV